MMVAVTIETWSRRRVLKGAAVAPFAARALWMEAVAQETPKGNADVLFVGTQTGGASASQGVYAYRWDASQGTATPLGLAAAATSPTFLALSPDRKVLIAANEADTFNGKKTGSVSSYRVDGPRLAAISAVAAEGAGTCHVAVDHTGRCAFAANYSGGSAASFQLGADGRLSAAVSEFHYHGHGPVADRQEAPHAHRVQARPRTASRLWTTPGPTALTSTGR